MLSECSHAPALPFTRAFRTPPLRSETTGPPSFNGASIRSPAQIAFALNVSETDPFFTEKKQTQERVSALRFYVGRFLIVSHRQSGVADGDRRWRQAHCFLTTHRPA